MSTHKELPEELFDGHAVFTKVNEGRTYTIPADHVSAVLDAVVKLARERMVCESGEQLLAATLRREFPLFPSHGLDEKEHCCQWSMQQDRKRLHDILRAREESKKGNTPGYEHRASGPYSEQFLLGRQHQRDIDLAEISAKDSELERLRAIEHHAWHLYDAMCDDGSETLKIDKQVSARDLDALDELLPEDHPPAEGVHAITEHAAFYRMFRTLACTGDAAFERHLEAALKELGLDEIERPTEEQFDNLVRVAAKKAEAS